MTPARHLLLLVTLLALGAGWGGCPDPSHGEDPCAEQQQCVEAFCREMVRCQVFVFTHQGYCEQSFETKLSELTEDQRVIWYQEARECIQQTECLDVERCYYHMTY